MKNKQTFLLSKYQKNFCIGYFHIAKNCLFLIKQANL
jgi:hypothetical protein